MSGGGGKNAHLLFARTRVDPNAAGNGAYLGGRGKKLMQIFGHRGILFLCDA